MKAKVIAVKATPETSETLDKIAQVLRSSRGGVCAMALEFALPKLLSGQAKIVNGKLELVDSTEHQHAA